MSTMGGVYPTSMGTAKISPPRGIIGQQNSPPSFSAVGASVLPVQSRTGTVYLLSKLRVNIMSGTKLMIVYMTLPPSAKAMGVSPL